MGLVSAVASAIAAYAFTPMLAKFIADRFLSERITAGIDETLQSLSLDTTTDLFNLDRVSVDLPEPFTAILDRYHIDLGSMIARMRGLTSASEETVHSLAGDIASPTVRVLSCAIAFLAIFVGAFLLLSIVTVLLDALFRMPVLNGANIFFGALFGIAEAAVFVFVLAVVLSVLVRALGSIDPNLFGDQVVDNTVVCGFILEHNPFKLIYNVLE